MKSALAFFFGLILLSLLIISCNQSDLVSVQSPDQQVTIADIGLKLKEWSLKQPQPYIIFAKGDTSSDVLSFQNDFVTNLALDSLKIGYFEYYDSLFINAGYDGYIIWRNHQNSFRQILDSIDLSFTETQMSDFLSRYSLQLRMMKYDSLTLQLNKELIKWAYYHNPPQTITSGFYSFVNQSANFGGYSRPIFTYKGVQSLQYFTRKVNPSTLNDIITALTDSSLTDQKVIDLMSPIANIRFHTTEWGPE